MTAIATDTFVRAASLGELREAGRLVVHVEGNALCLFADGDAVHAVDNRCPHMGFPLHRGTVADGILTCHWHHARFDLCSGGTFDQFADDVRVFPVEVRGDDVYVDPRPRGDEVLQAAIEFGVEQRGPGWGRGLTTLTCLANLAPQLEPTDRPAALYHG